MRPWPLAKLTRRADCSTAGGSLATLLKLCWWTGTVRMCVLSWQSSGSRRITPPAQWIRCLRGGADPRCACVAAGPWREPAGAGRATNHLDLPAIEQLEEALESYEGALLLVTHDRRLLENVRLDSRWHLENGQVQELHHTPSQEK